MKKRRLRACANCGGLAAPNMADLSHEFPTRRQVGLSVPEIIMSDRMMRLETSMVEKAANQQAQIEQITALFAASQRKQEASMAPTPAPATPEPPAAGVSGATAAEYATSVSRSDDEDWKDYFGAEVWKKEKDHIRKNPFDQRNYGKKGDVIESFEQLMVVLLKTMTQLLDLKYDVRGIIKHGLMMAEKAAKDVYEPEAFTQYDDSVRSRAGHVGPTAFGTVDQEGVLRFFSCDNLKCKRAPADMYKSSQSSSRKDEVCLRFNDKGCSNKSCPYAHRCIACEEYGHAKKDCKNVINKKKDAK